MKRKVFNQCILPVLTYDIETLTLIKTSVMKLRRTRKMERSILDISFRDSTSIKVRNEEIRKRTRVDDTIECIAKQKWKWAGHIARTNDNR